MLCSTHALHPHTNVTAAKQYSTLSLASHLEGHPVAEWCHAHHIPHKLLLSTGVLPGVQHGLRWWEDTTHCLAEVAKVIAVTAHTHHKEQYKQHAKMEGVRAACKDGGCSLSVLLEDDLRRDGINQLDRSCSKAVRTEGDDGRGISHLDVHYYSWGLGREEGWSTKIMCVDVLCVQSVKT